MLEQKLRLWQKERGVHVQVAHDGLEIEE